MLLLLVVASCAPPPDASSDPSHALQPTAAVQALDYGGNQQLYYSGGKVIANAKLLPVWWGNYGFNATTQAQLVPFYRDIVASTYIDWLNEYGAGTFIGRGSVGSAYTITPSTSAVTVDAVGTELVHQIATGALPAPDANTVYAVTLPQQFQSLFCYTGWCADHWTAQYNGTSVRFFIVVDQAWSALTANASGSIAAVITDPDKALGNVSPSAVGWENDEHFGIVELCQGNTQSFVAPSRTSYQVAQLWSNSVSGCVAPPLLANTTGPNAGGNVALVNDSTPSTFDLVNQTGRTLSLEVGGTSPGLQVTFGPAGPIGPGGHSQLTLTAGPNAQPGPSYVTVFGRDTGSGAIVTRVRADYVLNGLYLLNPSVSASIGGSAYVLLQNGQPYSSQLSTFPLPTGVTASFSPTSVAANSYSWLTLTASAGAAPGVYPYRVADYYTGSAVGSLTLSCASGTTWCPSSQSCLGSGQTCAPACPDGVCNGNETCSSCALDCGACPPPVVCPRGQVDCCGDGSCVPAGVCRRFGC